MIYLTSDQHFGCADVIERHRRPFVDREEMDAVLVENWNSIVKPHDTVYILGDFCEYRSAQAMNLIKSLKGQKHLIRGNADKYLTDSIFRFDCPFESINPVLNLKLLDQWFMLTHYPMLSWPGETQGTIQAHGHLHTYKYSNLPRFSKRGKAIPRYDAGRIVTELADALTMEDESRGLDTLQDFDKGLIYLKNAFDVGVDNNDYKPVSVVDVISRLKQGECTVLTRQFFRPVEYVSDKPTL